jgi:hypothetical protein
LNPTALFSPKILSGCRTAQGIPRVELAPMWIKGGVACAGDIGKAEPNHIFIAATRAAISEAMPTLYAHTEEPALGLWTFKIDESRQKLPGGS